MVSSVISVSQLNQFIKSLIEQDGRLNDFFLSGEISNFTNHYRSGHLYFSLKDEKASVKAVMFAKAAGRLKFMPMDGMKVIIRGRVSVYEPSGQYQIYVNDLQPDGVGAASVAFEQLKLKLQAEGIFDSARKRSLPLYPSRIGVITSPTGAAVQDILQITGRRWPAAEIALYPVLVQGDNASVQLAKAVREMSDANVCDVIIIGRGGGSFEDLQAFNDEGLARAIFAANLPIISAVGHETDFTICDFAADLRAPTPSAAAELATPDIAREKEKIAHYDMMLRGKAMEIIGAYKQRTDMLVSDSVLGDPKRYLSQKRMQSSQLIEKMRYLAERCLNNERERHRVINAKLDALSPLKIFARGYAAVYQNTGEWLRSGKQLKHGDIVEIKWADSSCKAAVTDQ